MSKARRKEHSAGMIVYRETDPTTFLLVHSVKHAEWGYPKGHLERDETIEQAARRELAEEVGPIEVQLVDGFHETMFYPIGADGKRVVKRVDWFLARHVSGTPQTSDEIDRVDWWTADQVESSGELFPLLKRVVKKAMRFIVMERST